MHKLASLLFLPLTCGLASAATTAAYDGGVNTPAALQTFGDPGAATIEAAGGNPGGFLQLTSNINGQRNYATYDRTDVGAYATSTFSFQFRVDNLGAGGADGFSLSYLPTSGFGTSGGLGASPHGAPEDPAAAGALGFGFDTWGNAAPTDFATPAEFGSNYSEVSVFWNGALIARIDDTRLLATDPFNLKDGAWHQVDGSVNFGLGTVSLSVDTNPLWSALNVPGLSPFESRIALGARTGGANARHGIDNLNVQWAPEPGSAILASLAGLGLGIRRRK